MENVDRTRFDQLRVGLWRHHAQDWLVGEEHDAPTHGAHVACIFLV